MRNITIVSTSIIYGIGYLEYILDELIFFLKKPIPSFSFLMKDPARSVKMSTQKKLKMPFQKSIKTWLVFTRLKILL